jgi:superfamily II DNA or RNA helicase
MLEIYKNKYIAEINQWRADNSRYPDHQIYERLWAIEKSQILWSDIPPGFEDIYELPTRNDYGIDLIDLKYTETSQVKFYRENSTITWTAITNYTSYSRDILGINNLNILTTPEAKIDKMVKRLLISNLECIQRQSFEALIGKIPEKLVFDRDIKCSEIEPRPYLVSTSESIIASDKPLLKVQWPCGVGKTYLALYLFTLFTDKVFLFITPWRSLGRQILQECKFLHINAGMIGDGKKAFDKSWKFIICLTASIHLLPEDLKVDYKFGDEGHHFEREGEDSAKFNNIIADKTILLSATFHNPKVVDYIMTKREAIGAGIITDYKIHFQYYTGARKDAILKMVKKNSEWIPMFIYFNTTVKAKEFYKLLRENDITADYLIGEDGEAKRNRIKERVTNGLLSVVCLCGVWNEGESVHILRTVIFGDLRHSSINIRQVAQRGSRKHPSKPFYNIVLPIAKNETEEDVESEDETNDLWKILKIFSDEDPVIRKSIEKKSYTRFNIRLNNEIVKENDTEESILLYREVFDSLGEMLEDDMEKWQQNLEWCKNFIILNRSIPSKNIAEIYYNSWLLRQRYNYRDTCGCMRQEAYRKKWEEFESDPLVKPFLDDKYLGVFIKQLNAYYSLYCNSNRDHTKCRKNDEKIAGWRHNQLQANKGKDTGTVWNVKRKNLILELMPDFFETSFDGMRKCEDYYHFYLEQNSNHAKRPKKSIPENETPEAKTIREREDKFFRWRNMMRVTFRKKQSEGKSENNDLNYYKRVNLTDDMVKFLTEKMPDFFEDKKVTDEDRMKKVEEYCKFFEVEERRPIRNKNNEIEFRLAEWRGGMKAAFHEKDFFKGVLTDEMTTKLLSVDPDFFKDDIKTDYDREKQVEEYIEWRKINPHPKTIIQNKRNEDCTDKELIQKKWSLFTHAINNAQYNYPENLVNKLCTLFPETFKVEKIKNKLSNPCPFVLKTGKRKGELCGKPHIRNSLMCSSHKNRLAVEASEKDKFEPIVYVCQSKLRGKSGEVCGKPCVGDTGKCKTHKPKSPAKK